MQMTRPMVAAAVVSVAVAVMGCGGSSSNTKASTVATPASSSTPTTSATPSTPSGSNAGQVAKTARVASPAYYDFALQVTNNTASYLSPNQARFAAHCIQNRFLASGFKTQGDVEKAAHGAKVRDILTTCFLKGRDH